MIERKNIRTTIDDTPIATYFNNSTNNFRQSLKDKANGVKLNDSRSLSVSLKDGIDGFYAKSGFDLFDLVPNLPLSQLFRAENVPVRFGGGFVETVNAVRLTYTLQEGRLTGTKTNEATLQGVESSVITVPAYAFQRIQSITEFERMKSAHINYDIMSHKLAALQLSYQIELEKFAFVGNLGVNDIAENTKNFHPGLLNLGDDIAYKEYFGSDWADADVDALIEKFVGLLSTLRVKLQFDKVPNTMLIPTELWKVLLKPAVVGATTTGATGIYVSNLDYLETQLGNLIRENFYIRELPYLDKTITKEMTTAGITVPSGQESRVVVYRNSEDVFRMNVPMPLTGGQTYMSHDGWSQRYISLVTPPLFVYPSFAYMINGTE